MGPPRRFLGANYSQSSAGGARLLSSLVVAGENDLNRVAAGQKQQQFGLLSGDHTLRTISDRRQRRAVGVP